MNDDPAQGAGGQGDVQRPVPRARVGTRQVVQQRGDSAVSAPDAASCLARETLLSQYDIACALMAHHLQGLTTDECLWRPAARCLHVHEVAAGRWRADWPAHERYEIGPPSIAWTTWHVCYWWRKALQHLDGITGLSHEDVDWTGCAPSVCQEIDRLTQRWRERLADASDTALHTPGATAWPIPGASLRATAAWLNLELMKNAAEIGMIRFLYAVRST